MSTNTSEIGKTSYEEKIQNGRNFVAEYDHLSRKWQLIELLKQATNIEDGYTSAELASILFPSEVDENGYATKDAKRSIHIKEHYRNVSEAH